MNGWMDGWIDGWDGMGRTDGRMNEYPFHLFKPLVSDNINYLESIPSLQISV